MYYLSYLLTMHCCRCHDHSQLSRPGISTGYNVLPRRSSTPCSIRSCQHNWNKPKKLLWLNIKYLKKGSEHNQICVDFAPRIVAIMYVGKVSLWLWAIIRLLFRVTSSCYFHWHSAPWLLLDPDHITCMAAMPPTIRQCKRLILTLCPCSLGTTYLRRQRKPSPI